MKTIRNYEDTYCFLNEKFVLKVKTIKYTKIYKLFLK